MLCCAEKDPCRKITRKVERKKKTTTYKSPETKYAFVIRQIKTDTFFAVLFHFSDEREHFETRGAAITFEDGTEIVDENVEVRCTPERSVFIGSTASASSSSNGGRYVLQAFFRISDHYIGHFATSRIVKVRLHNALQAIPKDDGYQLKTYVNCMMSKN
ncbi:hypothetical protein GCM10023093_27810 [Nemorincola caseinilytica]|uniref:Uncharacterized protein n=1 Tax=Nemorincola caseinilytica TaxID=2054315 RepID=A0ABP8NQ32_9BACT